jgi:hypothetical protein
MVRSFLILATILIIAVAVVAAAELYLQFPTGNETQTMNFSGFTAVDVGSAFKVDMTQSNAYSVTITANQKIFDKIEVKQVGNTLKIDIQSSTFTGPTNALATITMPNLSSVVFSGATSGTATGFRSTQAFIANLSGASSLGVTNFQAGNITADLSGASTLNAVGSANGLYSVISGASTLNLSSVPVNYAQMNLSGASHAEVDVNGRLDAVLTEASSLQYGGQTTLGNISTSGASSVTKK